MMNEESKELARDRMKKYWADVKAGRREHPTPGRPKKVEAAPVSEAPTPPPPAPAQEKPKISPIAHAEGIHFPMPGVKAEISFMVDKQQPVAEKPHPRPNLNPPVPIGDKQTVRELTQLETDYTKPKVIVAVGRKVAVKFTPKKQGTPTRVIMQFGRRRRLAGDL